MPAEIPNRILEKAVQLGDHLAAVQAIGVSGSQARGETDIFSDIDICVFVSEDYPTAKIRHLAYADLGFKEALYFDIDFDTSRGDGFMVDEIRCDFNWMVTEKVRIFLANLLSDFDCAEWLPGGLASIKALRDSQTIIQQLQTEIPSYPKARSRHRVQQALQEAHFSLYGLQWLPKAIHRRDVFSFLKYQYVLIEKLFYALFALNRVWFSDEKRLAERIMDFDFVPPQSDKRIQAIILQANGNGNLEDCLMEIKALFADTTQIAHRIYPDLELRLHWK